MSSMMSILLENSSMAVFDSRDCMPGMDMSEAANASVFMMQDAINESIEASRRNDEACMKAIFNESASAQYLIEMSVDGIWAKIKKMFESIKKFFMSVFQKIRMFFDKVFMSSKNLVSKYKNSDVIKNNTFDDLTYEGYNYVDNIGDYWTKTNKFNDGDMDSILETVFDKSSDFNIESVKNTCLKLTKNDKENESADWKEVNHTIESIKDVDESDRKVAVIQWATEIKVSADTAHSDLMEVLQGGDTAKVTITGADKYKIMDYLSKPEKENKILKFYSDIIKNVDDNIKKFKKAADAIRSDMNKEKSDNIVGADLYLSYVDTLSSALSSAFKNLNIVGTAKVTAIQGKAKQYRMVFNKMLSYKKKKNEAYDIIDTMDDFDTSILDYMD